MGGQLSYTMFQEVFFPSDLDENATDGGDLFLAKELRFKPQDDLLLRDTPLVIFDFETTGLNPERDRIIEIGGLKIVGGKAIAEFQTLVKVPVVLSPEITKLTGITREMLEEYPTIDEVLPKFLSFIDGAILAAHNADFDMSMLTAECSRLGFQIEWPCFCTLKLARTLLPDLNSRSLDSLADHYGLKFEARHRSIGDCKVTHAVFTGLLAHEGQQLIKWRDFAPYMAALSR